MPKRKHAKRVQIKRAYEPPSESDGKRILVDRLWPRGVSKEAAALDGWMKELAPSAELRKFFGHDPARWEDFQARYRAELAAQPEVLQPLRTLLEEGPITLVYGARDPAHNNALVLRALLLEE